jgi:hypothetical protein
MNPLRPKAAITFFAFFSLLLPVLGNPVFSEEREMNVSFRWAFGAMVGSENDRRLVAVTRDTVLKTGDQLKMLVELKEPCFVYLLYHNGAGEMAMLFPYDLTQFDTDYRISEKYYIPQGNAWFELDEETGLETFYLLASAERLAGLEAVYREYMAANAAKKAGIAEEMIKKIREINKKHRKFTTSAERPIPIGGNIRGVKAQQEDRPPDIDPIAAEVSSDFFYSRAFTIDHR